MRMPRIDDAVLDELVARAQVSSRRRMNLNIHATLDAAVNRLFNAVEPDSYIRPHRHPDRWELLLPVRGMFDVVFFDGEGRVSDRVRLGGPGGLCMLEYPAGTWHSLCARQGGSVFFEVKEGPYVPTAPEDFAPWAPAEGDPSAQACRAFIEGAASGEAWTGR